jgi:hypothetical protein
LDLIGQPEGYPAIQESKIVDISAIIEIMGILIAQ